jgi:hypothetical protein
MPRTKLYYTLLVRNDKQSPWGIEFGDYHRNVVSQERDDYLDTTHPMVDGQFDFPKKNNTLIISTGDTQAEIQARVDELNAALK